MAVAVLAPWPTTPAALTAARACLRELIRGTVADTRLDSLGSTAADAVQQFAPDAPQTTRNEATLRLAAWMHAREPKPVQGITVGSIRLDFRERFYAPNAMINSGARALLVPYRARRALPVEETD